MSELRATVLGSVRAALGRPADKLPPPEAVKDRLAQRPQGPKPALAAGPEAGFVQRLEAAAGTFDRAESPREVGGAVVRYLEGQGLPLRFVVSPDTRAKDLLWPEASQVEKRMATAQDTVAVVYAFAGIAETGSLVLLSGPDSPTRQNFLPDHFIAILPSHCILSHLEDVWQALRSEIGSMPRTVNFVTGPSRTADVEQTIQLGAHGPRKVHVILLGTQAAEPLS